MIYQITLQSVVHEIGGHLIYCSDANMCVLVIALICSIGKTPWFIAYDEKYDSVVISIRGTWSLTDVVTDLMAGSPLFILSCIEVHPLEDDGIEFGFDGKNEYTHEVCF